MARKKKFFEQPAVKGTVNVIGLLTGGGIANQGMDMLDANVPVFAKNNLGSPAAFMAVGCLGKIFLNKYDFARGAVDGMIAISGAEVTKAVLDMATAAVTTPAQELPQGQSSQGAMGRTRNIGTPVTNLVR